MTQTFDYGIAKWLKIISPKPVKKKRIIIETEKEWDAENCIVERRSIKGTEVIRITLY